MIFFSRIRRLLLTLDTIDILYLVYSNLNAYKMIFEISEQSLMIFKY